MKLAKVSVVYFSPTGNSKKCALAAAEAVGREIIEYDITTPSSCINIPEFDALDFIVFSAPVYGGRLYKGFVECLRKIDGNYAKCIALVSFGNRNYDDALLEFKNVLIEQNFVPLGFGAIVGRHTYGNIQIKRPDNHDLKICRLLAKSAMEKVDKGNFDIPFVKGNFPYKEGGNGGSFIPSTNERCANCGECARRCPQSAISFTDFRHIDKSKCISCFRCIRLCRYGAKDMTSKEYLDFAADFSKRLEEPKEDEIFL